MANSARTNQSSKHSDVESGTSQDRFGNGFSDVKIRNAFIRKVYAILAAQFLITGAISAFLIFHKPAKEYIKSHQFLLIISWFSFMVVYIVIACCEGPRRQYPCNFILLLFLTITMAITISFSCVYYSIYALAIAIGITFVVCLCVSLFSIWTKFDITKLSWIVFFALIIFALAGVALIFVQDKTANIVYAAIGVVLFVVYLAIDTQKIVGGRRYEISPEDYILASLILYMDIINIFLYILQLVGQK